jgi:hypothetical protein
VALDVHAFRRLLQSDLPVALYPCATQDGAFALGPNNTYWQLPNLAFIGQMHPQLRRYLDFAFGKSLRHDFLRAMEVTDLSIQLLRRPMPNPTTFGKRRYGLP